MGKQARIRMYRREERYCAPNWYDRQPPWRQAMLMGLLMCLCALFDSILYIVPLVFFLVGFAHIAHLALSWVGW